MLELTDPAVSTRLALAEQQWRLTFEAAPHGIAIVSPSGQLLHVNQALADLLGRSCAQLQRMTFQELTHPDDLMLDLGHLDLLLDGAIDKYSLDKRYRHADGRWIWVSLSVGMVRDPDTGTPVHFVSTIQDITNRVAAQVAAGLAITRQKAIIEAQTAIAGVQLTPGAVLQEICEQAMELTDADGAVVELREGADMVYRAAAGTAAPHVGFRVPVEGSLAGLCAAQGRAVLCPDTDHDERVNAAACRAIGVRSMVAAPLRSGGEIFGVLKVVSPRAGHFTVEDEGTLELLAAPFGAALANAHQMELAYERATTDQLTGLGNRHQGLHELDRALARQSRHDGRTAVLFIDLDGFKAVNDLRGHHIGDRVLTEVADRIRAAKRDTDTAIRFGGDEFIVIAEGFSPGGGVETLARRLVSAISAPYPLDGEPAVHIGASIGIAVATGDTAPAELINAADEAMYRAKRAGGTSWRQAQVPVPAA